MGKGKVIPFPGLYQKFSNEEAIRLLGSKDYEEQWMAVEQLKRNDLAEQEFIACRKYLREEKNSPFVKSAILQVLKEKGIGESIVINKFGQKMTVRPIDLLDIGDDELFSAVSHGLGRNLEPENPTLYEMALELWEHFMIAMFPLPVSPHRDDVWAGAVHAVVYSMNGMEDNVRNTVETYKVQEEELREATEKIKTVENASYY